MLTPKFESALVDYTAVSFATCFECESTMAVHDIIHPFAIVLSAILQSDPSLDSLVIVPQALVDLSITSAHRVPPEKLSVTVSLVVSKVACKDCLASYPKAIFVC